MTSRQGDAISVVSQSTVATARTRPTLSILAGFGGPLQASDEGRRRGPRDGVLLVGEDGECCVHPVGRQLAFRNLESGDATYAQESTRVEFVTAMAVSADRALLAVCERCLTDPAVQVSVYDLRLAGIRPAQTLEELNGAVGTLTCVAFSVSDEGCRLCLTSEGAGEIKLLIVDWQSNVVLAICTLSSSPDRVAFSPQDSDAVSVSGPHFFGLWAQCSDRTLAEVDGIKELFPEGSVFVDHAWVNPFDHTILVCLADGSIYQLDAEEGIVLGILEDAFRLDAHCEQKSPENAVVCLRCFPKGFALGGKRGMVVIWEVDKAIEGDEDAPPFEFTYVCTARVRLSEAAVCCLDTLAVAAEDEGKLVCGFSDGQLGSITVGSFLAVADTLGASEEVAVKARDVLAAGCCEFLCGGFHTKAIVALDMAAQRPIIASISKDSSVRIWNYAAKRCEVVHEFKGGGEEPIGVAIHPLGFLLAVMFPDKLQFSRVLSESLLPFKEIYLRGARSTCFSIGGHLIAIVVHKMVLVFTSGDLKKVATLKGHTQPIAQAAFDAEDQVLVAMAENGVHIAWSTHTWQKIGDSSGNASEGCSVLGVGVGGRTWCGAKDCGRWTVRGYKNCAPVDEEEFELPDGSHPTALCSLQAPSPAIVGGGSQTTPAQLPTPEADPIILAGTEVGSVWCCLESRVRPLFTEFGLHVGACSAICRSIDGNIAATGGADGAVFVLQVRSSIRRNQHGDVVMVKRAELQALAEDTQELVAQNALMLSQLNEEAARRQNQLQSRIEEAKIKDGQEINKLRAEYENLQLTATKKERENLRLMKSLEASHLQAADELEHVYDKKIRAEAERYFKLQGELTKLQGSIRSTREVQIRQLDEQHLREQQELNRRITQRTNDIHQLKELVAFTRHRFDTMLDQEGFEHDLEITNLNRTFNKELEQQHVVEYIVKKEQDLLLRSIEMMEKARYDSHIEQEEAQTQKAAITKRLDELTKAMASLKEDRQQRERMVREKEMEIGTYKQKVNTLSKFKRVLDYRIREVKASLQPKEQMIAEMSEELVNLEAEFEKQLTMQRESEDSLKKAKERVTKLIVDNERLKEVVKQRDRKLQRFGQAINELVEHEQDLRLWPKGILKIYKEHVQGEAIQEENVLANQEMKRQITNLEKKAISLEATIRSDGALYGGTLRSQTQDNSSLLEEMNQLRADIKKLKEHESYYQLKVHEKEVKLNQLRGAHLKELGDLSHTSQGDNSCGPASQDLVEKRGIDKRIARPPPTPPTTKAPVFAASLQSLVKSSHPGKSSRKQIVEEKKQLSKLMLEMDRTNHMIELQALENKILRDQLVYAKQSEERTQDDTSTSPKASAIPAPTLPAGVAAARAASARERTGGIVRDKRAKSSR